jgi:dihydroorotase (multifunctional complex type)
VDADILVSGTRVAALVRRDDPTSADETIDATGLDAIPGLVDLHAHTRVPGYEHKEDFTTASQAAAAGGITTFVDMPNVEPPTDSAELLLEKRAIAQRDCIVDWGHFASGSKPDNIAALAEAGATGFKIFMIGGGYPHDDRIAVHDHAQLLRSFEAIAPTGLPCLVHPFSQELFDDLSRRAIAAQPDVPDFVVLSETYSRDVLWRLGVAVLLELQAETGVRLHVLHTHAAGSLELVRRLRASGGRVTAALDVKYFHISRSDLDELGVRAAPGGFITEDPDRMAAIWNALADGTIDTIDSDHAPHTLEEVARIWSAQGGSPHYETMLSILLDDVARGALSMSSLVRTTAENPARLLGRFPEKGAILPGSSADIVLVDRTLVRTLSDEGLYTKLRWTPFLGRRVTGAPVMTMLRGTVIARDGTVTGEPGFGRYLDGRPLRFASAGRGLSPGLVLEPAESLRPT